MGSYTTLWPMILANLHQTSLEKQLKEAHPGTISRAKAEFDCRPQALQFDVVTETR